MAGILICLAILVGVFGVFLASQASAGAAIVGFACLLGILARIAQAAEYHKEWRSAANKPQAERPSAL